MDTRYDRIPYTTSAYRIAHPRFLAPVATLLGMEPPAPGQSRVLVVGCAGGGNLLPLACDYPDARFIGIDNSSREIEQARQAIGALGLSNVEARCMDIMDVDAGFGRFDFIIVHGVFSWVPETVRERILSICKENLADNGIAYISYNLYPGWHFRGLMRDIMLYKARNIDEPEAQVTEARAYMDTIARLMSSRSTSYAKVMTELSTYLKGLNDTYVYHDYMSEVNVPYHFYRFTDAAAVHGLQYLGDATHIRRQQTDFPPPMADQLSAISANFLELEQNADFLTGEIFRCSLLCHDGVTLKDDIDYERLDRFYLSSVAKVVDLPNEPRFSGTTGFTIGHGRNIIEQHPLTQQAIRYLGKVFPAALTFEELVREISSTAGTGAPSANDIETLRKRLLSARRADIVRVSTDMPRIATTVDDKPVASPFARLQAQSELRIITPWHDNAELNEFICRLMPLLDGSRDLDALTAEMTGLTAAPATGNATSPTPDQVRTAIGQSLEFLRRSGVLMSAPV